MKPTILIVATSLLFSTAVDARSNSAIEAARDVSVYAAITAQCSKLTEINIERATAYGEAAYQKGIDAIGERAFERIAVEEASRTKKEIIKTGAGVWCEKRRSDLSRLGYRIFQN